MRPSHNFAIRDDVLRLASDMHLIVLYYVSGTNTIVPDSRIDVVCNGNRTPTGAQSGHDRWSEKHIGWTRTLSDALNPYSSGGYLLNFLGGEELDAVRAAFGSNHARLVELKTKYDPTNFFSLNQNVVPMR
jgi:hypothetical protein